MVACICGSTQKKPRKQLFLLMFMSSTLICRALSASNLPLILRLQAELYPAELHESAAFFMNRIALAAATCRVVMNAQRLAGYLIAYPWDSGLPPALDLPLDALPVRADCWFVHDCAVARWAQGKGVARMMLRDSARSAAQAGLTRASLVSLASAVTYWEKQGYAAATSSADLARKLAGYGTGAVYMSRALPAQ